MFKVGDIVQYKLFSNNNDWEVGPITKETSGRYMVKTSVGELDFVPENLVLQSNVLKIGDRVTVNFVRMPEWKSATGCIIKLNDNSMNYSVKLDYYDDIIQFHGSQLDKIPNILSVSKPKTQFKIGERVRVLDSCPVVHGECIGTILQKHHRHNDYLVECYHINEPYNRWINANNLRFVSQSDTFKVGDRIKINISDLCRSLKEFHGKIATIVNRSFIGEKNYDIRWGDGSISSDWHQDHFVHFEIEKGPVIDIDKRFNVLKAGVACEACKGTGKILLLNSYVDCNCRDKE